jgi:putative ABC transport system substrate-binding protein
MRRIWAVVVLCMAFGYAIAEAQQSAKIYRLGILTVEPAREFEQELRKLGYVEGRNLVIKGRYTHGSLEAPTRLAPEIVEFRPDVILVTNGEMAGAILHVSRSIPIVVAAASDLVAQGLVNSLARPGGNVTGLQIMSGDLAGKRIELLREIVPKVTRLAVLVPSTPGGFVPQRRATEKAAEALGIQFEIMWVPERNKLAEAFRKVSRSRHDGLFVYSNPFTYSERAEIARLAAASGVPAIYETWEFVAAGGLVSYGPTVSALFRRAADYVNRILKGAKPADLPVEQPTTFELVINLKTAKALGLTISQTLLLRADQVIE